MRVRASAARILGWIGLVCTTGGLVVDPAWLWDYYTHWNLLLLYATSVISLQWPKEAHRWAEVAIMSAWTTALLYTLIIIIFPERISQNTGLFWALNSALHYVPAILASVAFDPQTRNSAPSLVAMLTLIFFYNITHNVEEVYDAKGVTTAVAIAGALVVPVLCFYIFLPGEYLSAQKLFW